MGSIKRGATISENANGTLERVDGTSTYIGSITMPDGKVFTKRFRSSSRDNDEVTKRWLKWQEKNLEDLTNVFGETEEPEMDISKDVEIEKTVTGPICPLMSRNGREGFASCQMANCAFWSEPHMDCSQNLGGIGLYNMAMNLMRLKVDDQLDLIAMAVADLKGSMAVNNAVVPVVSTRSDGLEEFFADKNFMDFVNLHSKTVYSEYRNLCEKMDYKPVKEKDLVAEIGKRFSEIKCQGVSGGTKLLYKG